MPSPACSVAIPVLNGADTVSRQLHAVLAQRCPAPFEVVVADNGSTDDTAALVSAVAQQDARLRLVDASGAPGEPGARNMAVAACRAPMVACCDADDIVRPGWLATIQQAFDAGAEAAQVTREYWTLNPAYRHAGFPETQLNGWLAGGAFAVRRDLYLDLGGFDPLMPVCADTEFGFRLQKHLGRPPVRLRQATVSVRMPREPAAVFQRVRRHARTWPELRRRHPDLMTPTADNLWELRGQLAWWLVAHAPLLTDRRRLRWIEVAATAWGEIEGSVGGG